MRFTFGEFVRFIVNGSIEFADDSYVLNHRGLSYHWAPYWSECELCSEITSPHFIIHLETFKQDLKLLIKHIQGDVDLSESEITSIVNKFPHTHKSAAEGSDVVDYKPEHLRKYLSTLTRQDIHELYEKYRLDFILFDYKIDHFLQYV